jgi:hypothetical protein
MKKGMANHFRTQAAAFAGAGAAEERVHLQEEEDHYGPHNVTYSAASAGETTTISRERLHDHNDYATMHGHPGRQEHVFQDSEIRWGLCRGPLPGCFARALQGLCAGFAGSIAGGFAGGFAQALQGALRGLCAGCAGACCGGSCVHAARGRGAL